MLWTNKNKSHSHKQNFLIIDQPKEKKFEKPIGFVSFLFHLLPYLMLGACAFILILVISVSASLGPYYTHLRVAYAESVKGQNFLQQAEKQVLSGSFAEAENALVLAGNNFQEANKRLQVVQKSAIFRNDYLHEQLVAAQEILQIGEQTADSLRIMALLGGEAQKIVQDKTINWQNLAEEKKQALLGLLQDSGQEFAQSKKNFQEINTKLSQVNARQPFFIFDRALIPLNENLPKLEKAFDGLLLASQYLPEFAGLAKEKKYLLLFLNNREIRPGGGFIGTYGVLNLRNGDIKDIFIDNIYNFDKLSEKTHHVPAPLPMQKYMDQKVWFTRDSNWSPDFLTSSQKTLELYRLQGGKENFDGVLALTVSVIEDLLGELGEFTVEGIKFNKDNFYDQLQYQVEYGYYKQGIANEERKDIIGALAGKIIEKLKNAPINDLVNLVDLLQKEISEKQVFAFFNNAELQRFAEQNFFAGRMQSGAGDYLAIVDANLAALKTDSVMTKTVIYDLSEMADGLHAELNIKYQNNGDFSWKTTRYRSYSRYYVPKGVQISEVKVGGKILKKEEYDFGEDLNKNFVGLFFEVEPKAEKEIQIKYQLPAGIFDLLKNKKQYSLLFQKQLGVPKINLQTNWQFSSAPLVQFNDLKFSNTKVIHSAEMRTDRLFEFAF
ncbi:MAG: DUF4012 domain-containing protein [Patescibacteria group bacterium]